MSLIIEDKTSLDSLANAIIGANGSVDKTSATKGELTDIINGIIPLKSKFASGVFTPSEDITSNNSPRINFALGNDENGIPIKPNVIIAYQPYGLNESTSINATIVSFYVNTVPLYHPQQYPNFTLLKISMFRKNVPTSSGRYVGAYFGASAPSDDDNNELAFNKNGFKLPLATDDYPFLAGHPIVWLQIKF